MTDSTALNTLEAHAAAAAQAQTDRDRMNLRRLPAIPEDERVPLPDRYSQTLLRHGNTCQRAAYLYLKHHGGMPGHQLDRGTALHMAQAAATNLLVEQHALDAARKTPQGWVPPDSDYEVDEGTAKLLLEEVFDQHPELTVPLHERDTSRMMISHLAHGWRINPATVVAVERKFLIPVGPYWISCVLDLARIHGNAAKIDDYKTQWDLPSQSDYEATFQGRLYAVALVYGHPVTVVPCATCGEWGHENGGEGPGKCDACNGRGHIDQLDAPLGEHLHSVEVGEVFPRYLSCSQCGGKDRDPHGRCLACGGLMAVPNPTKVLPRIEIDELRRDLEQQCAQLATNLASGELPAVSGSHCNRCPCEPECPLPRQLRNFAGAVTTDAEAKEAAEWLARVEGKVKATRDELKSYCRVEGPLRYGTDQIMEFGTVFRWDTDWPAIDRGARRAAQFGEPFDLALHRRQKPGTAFKVRTLTDAELDAERQEQQ